MSKPPTNSSTPAAPRSDTNCKLSKAATCGKPKNLAVPCCSNRSAVMMRTTDSRRGDQVWENLSIDAASIETGSKRDRPSPCPHLGALRNISSLRRCRLALGLHFGGIVVHQLRRNRAGREAPMRDLRDRRHLGGTAGDEAL